MKSFWIITIIAVGLVASYLVSRKAQGSPLQAEFNVTPRTTPINSFGLPEGKVTETEQMANTIKSNAITGNLITEENLRNIFNNRTGAKGLEIFRDENFTVTVEDKFKPIGQAQVLNPVTGKPINNKFVGRTQETYKIVTVDNRTGKTKTRFGSKELAERIQKNYAGSSIYRVA